MARANINQPPSQVDWENLGTISKEEKVNILYLYLYENMNMEEVAIEVFGTGEISESNKVSTVMRCYGFSGRNSGYFYKKLNYELNLNDFRDFVHKYPSGCQGDWPNHLTIDEFMRKKHMSKVNMNISGYDDNQYVARNTLGVLGNSGNRKQGVSKISEKKSIDSEDMDGTIIAKVLAVIVGMIFIISVIKYVIDHVPLLSYVYAEAGLLGICSLVCILGAMFLLIISLALKKLKKFFKVIVPMFAVGFLFAQILDGEIKGVLISACVAVVGYEFGLRLEKK